MITQVRTNYQCEGLPLFQPRGKGQAAEDAETGAGRGIEELGMGDEGCPSTPGKADLVRCLLRVTEVISDKDIDNSGFAGEQIQINH